jgi:hypothetical protein
MIKFVVEVYDDNDISDREIYIELLGRFGNMIAGVKETKSSTELKDKLNKLLLEFDAIWGGADPNSHKQATWRAELVSKLVELI